ncbi:MAG: helix-turn-helix domain-containing protein [Proteobacteria bacterium]|nr:helix-turn-helix domain-containing protein [Pseudomonadota bacterium]
MGRDRKNERRGTKVGGLFVPILHQTLDCDAWRALGLSARLLYIALRRRARPETNGRTFLSVRDAAEEIGVARNTIAEAFRDLQRHGFIVATQVGRLGVDGHGKASTWLLTEMKAPNEQSPPKNYLAWRAGADFPVAKGSAPVRKKQNPVANFARPRRNSCDVSPAQVTKAGPSCRNPCDVLDKTNAEPVAIAAPHLESAMQGSAFRSFAVVTRGTVSRIGVRVARTANMRLADASEISPGAFKPVHLETLQRRTTQ